MDPVSGGGGLMAALLQRPHEIVPFLILLLPLAGFVVLSLFGDAIRRHGESRGAGVLASGVVLASFGLSVWSVLQPARAGARPGRARASRSPTWASSGSRPADSGCRSTCCSTRSPR